MPATAATRVISFEPQACERYPPPFADGPEPQCIRDGISKPLTKPIHWTRNVGRLVNVAGDAINAIGRIVEFDDPNVTLDIKGKSRTISIQEISRANIEVEFKKMPKDEAEALSGDPDVESD